MLAVQRWGPYLQSCQWGFNMGKLKLSQISCPVVQCENRSFQLKRAKEVSHVGNIWIGPWENFLYHMDPTLEIISSE